MSRPHHIHIPCDGRGRRRVLLNGKPVKNVVYADTRRGIVRTHDDPPKIHRHRKQLITRTRRGLVEVFPC